MLWRTGNYYEIEEEYKTAIKYYKDLLENETKKFGDFHIEVNDIVISIANCYYYAKNLKKAIFFFEKSLKINKINGNKKECDKLHELVFILKKEITNDQ